MQIYLILFRHSDKIKKYSKLVPARLFENIEVVFKFLESWSRIIVAKLCNFLLTFSPFLIRKWRKPRYREVKWFYHSVMQNCQHTSVESDWFLESWTASLGCNWHRRCNTAGVTLQSTFMCHIKPKNSFHVKNVSASLTLLSSLLARFLVCSIFGAYHKQSR